MRTAVPATGHFILPAPTFLQIPSPPNVEAGCFWVREPADADCDILMQQIIGGIYDRPFVFEGDGKRVLYFSMAFVQSSMRLKDPFALDLAYTRKMMSFLLFAHQPKKILMLGMGGGSLAKYCQRHLPLARITVVELSPEVIAFGSLFSVPAEDERFQIVQADAATYVAECTERQDVILVDAFDQDGPAASVSNADFYANIRQALTQKGMLVANLAGSRDSRKAHLGMIETAFEDNVLTLPVMEDGNTIVIAFRDAVFEPRWRWITSQAPSMKARYGLDFPRYAKKLERSQKLGYMQRALSLLGVD